MSYLIRFKNAHRVPHKAGIKQRVSVDLYLAKDGELQTIVVKGRTQYVSGVKMTNRAGATRFDSVSDATKYQQLVGVKGRRGEIIKEVVADASK